MQKLTIYTDGASKGNPGDAGIGVVICDESGNTVKEISEYIGKETNNVAEYTALLVGLREAKILGAAEVTVITDSELMERQLNGRYQVKSPNIIKLYQEAKKFLAGFNRSRITHVLRGSNSKADGLANEGVKKGRAKKDAKPAAAAPKKAARPTIDSEDDYTVFPVDNNAKPQKAMFTDDFVPNVVDIQKSSKPATPEPVSPNMPVKKITSKNGSELLLINGDCIEGMKQYVPDGSIDVVVTSPPYNLGINYSQYDDNGTRDEYLKWMEKWAIQIKRVLDVKGSLFLNIGAKPTDPYVPFEIVHMMRDYFALQNVIYWVKSIAILKSEVGNYPAIVSDAVVGHYKPINSKRFVNDCMEFIFHFTHNGDVELDRLAVGVPYQDKTNIERWGSANGGLHCRGNTWFIPYDTINNREKDRPHPASFPVELPRRCIRLHGLEKTGRVLDPFLGIGTTAVACAELGKDFTGFEMAEDYFSISVERTKEKINGGETV